MPYIVNAETIDGLFVNLNTSWFKGFDSYKAEYPIIASKKPSSVKTEVYLQTSNMPAMRKFLGEKISSVIRMIPYYVNNDDFYNSITIPRDDIADGILNGYGDLAVELGRVAKKLPDQLVCGDAVNGMFELLCYDKQPMVHTDHPLYSSGGGVTTFSNKITKALSAASAAAAEASIGLAWSLMRSFKDADGLVIGGGMSDITLMVPPALEGVGDTLVNSTYLDDQASNPWKSRLTKLYVNRWMDSSTAWAIIDNSTSFRAFYIQERQAPTPCWIDRDSMSGQMSESNYIRQEFTFGTEARYQPFYGRPELIVGSTGTT